MYKRIGTGEPHYVKDVYLVGDRLNLGCDLVHGGGSLLYCRSSLVCHLFVVQKHNDKARVSSSKV